MRKMGMLGSTGQSWRWMAPMMIMHTGMMTVRPQAIVQPIVPISNKINLAKKSIRLRDDLWVSRILPNRESYEGGSAETFQKSCYKANIS